MKLLINGKTEPLKQTCISVSELLQVKNVEHPEAVSVQVNKEFVSRTDFDSTLLNDNDEVDFLYFMGGGTY
ncbi:MAG: sulfur carrier protein ThiS [Spirochaetales bacterium]|nr:sulfur carrier protein ThiS [Spirochaetales bacterium]